MPDLRTNPRGQNADTDGAGRRRGRGDGRIETHRKDAEGPISHAGDGGKRSTCFTAPAVGAPSSSDET